MKKSKKALSKGINLFLSGLILCSFSCKTGNQNIDEEKQGLKVDFDFSGRKLKEVHDPGYISWPVEANKAIEKSFGGINVAVEGNLNSSWYKAGIQAPYYARLVSDGLTADGSVEMTFSGLEEGEHSLLSFHNTFDNPETNNFAPINIYVNGEKKKTVIPSNRVDNTINSAMAYLVFHVEEGQDVTIRFEADKQSPASNREVVINGFELNLPDMMKQANSPQPEDKDEHVVLGEEPFLKWNSPEGTVSHQVYFGKSKEGVFNANLDSEEFKGEFTENRMAVNEDLYSMNTYYWRVDEIDDEGRITKGQVWSFRPAQLAFPGAEGYGRFALGGRGGKVVEVTNLNDSGPGSLRYAVNQDIGPRTIVFNVSGNIELESRLIVSQPYITIAGQTAPGKGITISRAPIGLTGNDGITRFLRVRIGAGKTYDGMGLTGANHSIIDHCSISWTQDEAFSSRGANNITLQRTLISEALNIANHSKYEKGTMHGYAASIGGDIGSFHHNLLAHNYGRNWSMAGGLNGNGYYTGRLDIRNNVVYNWGHRTTDGGAHEVNFVNNYYKPGAATTFFYALNVQHEGVGKGKQQYYFAGNIMTGYFDESNQKEGRISTISNNEIVDYETFMDEPFFPSYVATQSARAAYKNVLSDVGSNQPLDNHDKRIIQEVLDSTFTYSGSKSGIPGMIDTQEDVGGWEDYPKVVRAADWDTDHDGLPNWWEEAHGLNTESAKGDFSDANEDNDQDGFTQLNDYLNWMARPHYFLQNGGVLSIPAKELFMGFTANPEYSVSEGEASLKSGSFYFTGSEKGFHSFKVKVVDAEGDEMQRTVHVFVE